MTFGIRAFDSQTCVEAMVTGTRQQILDTKLAQHDEALGELATNYQALNETHVGIRGTL